MQPIFLDIETTGLNPLECEIALVQIMGKSGQPVLIQNINDIQKFKQVLESNLVIGHNLKFDTKFLKHHCGLNICNIYDTYLAELVISGGLQAGRPGAKLSDLALKYAGIELDKSKQTGFQPNQDLTPSQIKYASLDVQVLPKIYKAQQEIIKAQRMENTINIEMGCIPATVWLELSGMPVDLQGLEKLKLATLIKKEELEKQIIDLLKPGSQSNQHDLSGNGIFKINLSSPAQLLTALQNLGIDIHSTGDEELVKVDHPVCKLIQEYRGETKLLTAFIEKLPKHIHPLTKRIHADFNQFGAHSGRFSSSKPNMQQQPHGPEWRTLFKPNNGNKIIVADYSQIELRILAEVSKDKEFIKAFNDGVDLHKLTASKVFNVHINLVTKEQRSTAKTVNFGIAYGMWYNGLVKRMQQAGVKLTEDEAKDIIDNFMKAYPGVSRYLYKISEKGLIDLNLINLSDRPIKFNEPMNDKDKGSIKRQAKNLPIQSVCADILKTAMAKLYYELADKDIKLINTVHDELVFEAPRDKAHAVAEIVKKEMEAAGSQFIKSIPVIVDVRVSDAWGVA
ncbi:MAG TPA: DNA polymerase [Bacteroidales bacterium]|nr:DNA polymerase [Bacteroidales bacterium]